MKTTSSIKASLLTKTDMHFARKFWHLSSGCLVLAVYHLGPYTREKWAYVSLAIGIASLIIDLARINVPYLRSKTAKIFGPILREEEYDSITGVPYYAIGCFIALYFNEDPWAVMSIYFLVFVDPIASFFGIKYGKIKLLGEKTWIGCIAGAITAVLVCYFVGEKMYGLTLPIPFILISAIGVALIEALSWKLDDNFSIPAFSGLYISYLAKLFMIT